MASKLSRLPVSPLAPLGGGRLADPAKGMSASARRSLYNAEARSLIGSQAWRRARAAYLAEAARRGELRCARTGALLIGTGRAHPLSPVVDHITPHRGDPALFWDRDNWQIVSKAWHDSEKQRLERRGLA